MMCDTVWNSEVQKLVNECGQPKGKQIILQEIGIDTTGMKAKDMRLVLKSQPDTLFWGIT